MDATGDAGRGGKAGLPDDARTELLDTLTLLAAACGVEVAAVWIADGSDERVHTAVGAQALSQTAPGGIVSLTLARGEQDRVDSTPAEPALAGHPWVESGVGAYAAGAVAGSAGDVVGVVGAFAVDGTLPPEAEAHVAAAVAQIERIIDRHEEQRHLQDLSRRLARSEQALATSNRELEDFAFFASHELQTPMRTVAAFASSLTAGRPFEPALVAKVAARVESEAARMRAQIDGLLALSRLSTDLESGARTAVDLAGITARVLEGFAPLLDEIQARVDVAELATVMGDAAGLETVLSNLMTNAIRYRDPERPLVVNITARRLGNEVEVRFRDNGRGVAAQDRVRIFEAFQRSGGDVAGAGIGLTLCRRIVERCGGTIEVASEPGAWTEFTITLDAD